MLWYIYVYDRYEPRFVAQQDSKPSPNLLQYHMLQWTIPTNQPALRMKYLLNPLATCPF